MVLHAGGRAGDGCDDQATRGERGELMALLPPYDRRGPDGDAALGALTKARCSLLCASGSVTGGGRGRSSGPPVVEPPPSVKAVAAGAGAGGALDGSTSLPFFCGEAQGEERTRPAQKALNASVRM